MSKLLGLIPPWGYVAAALAVASVMGLMYVRIADLNTELAEARQAASDERAGRALAAAEHATDMRELQAKHATDQQLKENEYAKTLAALESRRAAAVAELGRLRGTITTYTAPDRRPGETDTVALERAENRLAVVGRLLEQGVGLLIEGRGVVEGRDAEVKRLLDQVALDRETCQFKP